MKQDADKTAVKPRWALVAESLMAAKGIRQEDLKETFGVKTRGSVGHYLSGRREPSIDQIMSLAKRLGVTTSELVGEIPLADSQYMTRISELFQAAGPEHGPLLEAMVRAAVSEIVKQSAQETE